MSEFLYKKPARWVDPSLKDKVIVESLLGKVPQSEWTIVVCDKQGNPQVIENAPFFLDGTPMPTRYWLVDSELVQKVSKLESQGGVKQAQIEIDPDVIKKIHFEHEKQRNQLFVSNYDGPKPTGGVGGTRKGVKCLHTHLANYLATGKDEVGEWTLRKISEND